MKSVRDDIDGEALSAAVVELQDLVGVVLRVARVQGRQNDRHSKGIVQGRTSGKTEDGFVSVSEEDQELVQHLTQGGGLDGGIVHAVADEVPDALVGKDLVGEVESDQGSLGCDDWVAEDSLGSFGVTLILYGVSDGRYRRSMP